MNRHFQEFIKKVTQAKRICEQEVIQSLWSGYGEIVRLRLDEASVDSVIVKYISLPTQQVHPRGWSGAFAHARKLKSYHVESHWYRYWSQRCTAHCRVATCYAVAEEGNEQVLVLEDLDAAGYAGRYSRLNFDGVTRCLRWLARFHATFIGVNPDGLWDVGTYWHLDTRPDEWQSMEAGELKRRAHEIDQLLNTCRFKTLVHGDAKVANFCFSQHNNDVAAVDFQYVGAGCGMKDVAYFLGSCLSDQACFELQDQALDFYFNELRSAISSLRTDIDLDSLEKEWRALYPLAVADFYRFLLGWAPTHDKINPYSQAITQQVLRDLELSV